MMETIQISAHPNYYDYIHCLTLMSGSKCNFTDGGGQCINGDWSGTWEMENKFIKLSYNQERDYHNTEAIDPPITIEANVEIVDEYHVFFDGYCLSLSSQTWKFSKSPCPSFEMQHNNLFNVIEGINEENTPLTFYKVEYGHTKKFEMQSELLSCEFLRFADRREWLVKSPTDIEPIIESVVSGLAKAKGSIEEARSKVEKFICELKAEAKGQSDIEFISELDRLPNKDKLSKLHTFCIEKNNPLCEDISELMYSRFDGVYKKFKGTRYYKI
jgi:hypothetical protein